MASLMAHHTLCLILLLAALVYGDTEDEPLPSCPPKCTCLGNIVDCSESQMTSLPDNIGLYTWIEQLQLNQNPGLNLTEGVLAQLPNLSVLELESLGLQQPPPLGELPSLSRLSLRDNELKSMGDLRGLQGLKVLDVSRNELTELPADLPLPNLKKLNLDRNRISTVTGVPNLSGLLDLRLAKNFLTKDALESSKLFNNMPALTSLNLNGNRLQELPALLFQNCTSLKSLKISRNQLSLLSDGAFYGLENLRTLSLDYNNLTVVSKSWLFGLTSLEELYLHHNSISSITPLTWDNTTPNLEFLDLSYNKLVALHPSSLKGLKSLKYLQLSHNQLSTILPNSFESTHNLRHLDLAHNSLSWTVEDKGGRSYLGLSSLQRLDLSYNGIEALQSDALAPMTGLMKLNLRGNDIKTLLDSPFSNMVSELDEAPQILLNTSSVVCDCHLDWFPLWLQSTPIILGGNNGIENGLEARCSYPPSLKGTPITLLPNERLPCTHSPRPRILTSPHDSIVLLDAHVELVCEALVGSRGGEPLLMWRRDNHLVEPYKLEKHMKVERTDPEGGIISRVESVLHLARVTHQDAGNYQCIVRNDFGADYSEKAVIEVQVKPYFTVFPSDVSVLVGKIARIDCAADGVPPPEMSLMKGMNDEVPAARDRRLLVDTEKHAFFISPVFPEDEGTYTCTANSTAGLTTASANITVNQAPLFLEQVTDMSYRAGDTAVMRCQGSGRPKPKLTWLHKDKPIPSNPRFVAVDDGEFLLIMDVQSEDDGLYTCVLTNTYGSLRQTLQLTVYTGLLVDSRTAVGIALMSSVVCIFVTSLCFAMLMFHFLKRRWKTGPKKMKGQLSRGNLHHPALGFPQVSPPTSPQIRPVFSPLLADMTVTDPLVGDVEEDAGVVTDVVLVGPDTSSEHSAGKDSGVGADSSQRSNEDLRQLGGSPCLGGSPNLSAGGMANGDIGRGPPVSVSSLMVHSEQLSPLIKGRSSLSVATDCSDGRYDDLSRPRLSTFGSSTTLRRPPGHKLIAVAAPNLLRHNLQHTATLPHRGSLRAAKRKTSRETFTRPLCDENRPVEELWRERRLSAGGGSPVKTRDSSPYSRPSPRMLTVASRQPKSPAGSLSNDVSAKCLSPDAPTDDCSPSLTNTNPSMNDTDHRQTSPAKMLSSKDIYKHRSELIGVPPLSPTPTCSSTSDYSTPSVLYSHHSGVDSVEINSIGRGSNPTPPPIPPLPSYSYRATSLPPEPLYGRTSMSHPPKHPSSPR